MTVLSPGGLNNASILSLRCFVAVVETQSFSAAARQLRLAASSVTKHVQLLEAGVRVALVHRTTRRISVTEAGERFYEQCLGILGQVDSLASAMTAESALAGHLRVTVPPSFAATALGPHIHSFLAAHPQISVDVMVTSATPDLVRDRIDVAIAIQEEPESKLAHFLLAENPRAVCASPAYLAKHGVPSKPQDLLQHECLSGRFSELAEPLSVRRMGSVRRKGSLRRKGTWETIRIPSRLLSDNGELLRQACVTGAGIGNFYYFHVREDLEQGRLVRLLTDYEFRSRHIYAVVPHRQIVRPQTKAFIDFARDLAGSLLGAEATAKDLVPEPEAPQ